MVKERKYSIIRSKRIAGTTAEKVVMSGLPGFKVADHNRNLLTDEYSKENPEKTTWTRDLFIVKQEACERCGHHHYPLTKCGFHCCGCCS